MEKIGEKTIAKRLTAEEKDNSKNKNKSEEQ